MYQIGDILAYRNACLRVVHVSRMTCVNSTRGVIHKKDSATHAFLHMMNSKGIPHKEMNFGLSREKSVTMTRPCPKACLQCP